MVLSKIKITKLCDGFILFSIYAIAFFLPISKAIIESCSILAITFYLIKKIINFDRLPDTQLNLWILIYLTVCASSIFTSSNPAISSRTFFAKTLQNFAFFFAVVEALSEKKKIKNTLNVLLLSSLVLGIDGVYQYFTRQDFLRHREVIFREKIYASFVTPNAFGCYLTMVIPFLISRFFYKFKLKASKFIYFALFALLFICLLLTISRGSWLAFIGSTLFLSIWIHALGLSFLVLGIIMTAIQPLCHPLIKERIAKFFIFSDTSSINRKLIWQAGWKMFISKPWIGLGLGTFMFNFKQFVVKDFPHGAAYAHNCYLQMAAEIGIIGLASFLVILALFFYQGIKTLNTKGRTFMWYALLASQASIFGYCVQMGVDTTLYALDLGMLFWLVLGIGVAAMRNLRRESV